MIINRTPCLIFVLKKKKSGHIRAKALCLIRRPYVSTKQQPPPPIPWKGRRTSASLVPSLQFFNEPLWMLPSFPPANPRQPIQDFKGNEVPDWVAKVWLPGYGLFQDQAGVLVKDSVVHITGGGLCDEVALQQGLARPCEEIHYSGAEILLGLRESLLSECPFLLKSCHSTYPIFSHSLQNTSCNEGAANVI
ncbi:hypothetical protein Q8A73_003271 [Channa argus]|nr:hypothetical protein Q8A73_003271 [Channa argus]